MNDTTSVVDDLKELTQNALVVFADEVRAKSKTAAKIDVLKISAKSTPRYLEELNDIANEYFFIFSEEEEIKMTQNGSVKLSNSVKDIIAKKAMIKSILVHVAGVKGLMLITKNDKNEIADFESGSCYVIANKVEHYLKRVFTEESKLIAIHANPKSVYALDMHYVKPYSKHVVTKSFPEKEVRRTLAILGYDTDALSPAVFAKAFAGFASLPVFHFITGMYDGTKKVTAGSYNAKELACGSGLAGNNQRNIINVVPPYDPNSLPKDSLERAYKYLNVLDNFLGCYEDGTYIETILKVDAQAAMEIRTAQKPLLVLNGVRNSGKSFISERHYTNMFGTINDYKFNSNFTPWKNSADVVVVKEMPKNADPRDKEAMIAELKEYLSGGVTDVINKYEKPVKKLATGFACINSNANDPIRINDLVDEYANTFMVMDMSIPQADIWTRTFFDQNDVNGIEGSINAKCYIHHILRPIYEALLLNSKSKSRIGFPIPATDAMVHNYNASTQTEDDMYDIAKEIQLIRDGDTSSISNNGDILDVWVTALQDHSILSKKFLNEIVKDSGMSRSTLLVRRQICNYFDSFEKGHRCKVTSDSSLLLDDKRVDIRGHLVGNLVAAKTLKKTVSGINSDVWGVLDQSMLEKYEIGANRRTKKWS